MCYTCTYSLCKGCIKEAGLLCVRGNKGFCETCMKTVMQMKKVSRQARKWYVCLYSDLQIRDEYIRAHMVSSNTCEQNKYHDAWSSQLSYIYLLNWSYIPCWIEAICFNCDPIYDTWVLLNGHFICIMSMLQFYVENPCHFLPHLCHIWPSWVPIFFLGRRWWPFQSSSKK